MLKKILIPLLGVWLSAISGQAFEVSETFTESLAPTVTVSRDDTGITTEYVFTGAYVYEDDLYPDSYHYVIPGFGSNMCTGEPEWLVHWDTYEIPTGSEVSVSILSSESSVVKSVLSPAREDLINSSDEVYSKDNVLPIRDFEGWLPENPIEKGRIRIYRDRHILYVGVYPISYNKSEGLVKAFDKLTYRVDFISGSMAKSSSKDAQELHHVDIEYMHSLFSDIIIPSDNEEYEKSALDLNAYSSAPNWHEGEGYLILSCPDYTDAVKRFADWKKIMGYNVKVIYADDWTPEKIHENIKTQYNDWPSLTYLLFIGDEIDIPGEYHSTDMPYYTDYFYACQDSEGDDTPDLSYGRLSVTTLEEANTVVDKIINYESLASVSGYYGVKAVHCAEFSDNAYKNTDPDGYEDRRFTRTSEDIANGMESEGREVQRIYFRNDGRTESIAPTNWATGSYGYGEEIPDFLKDPSFNWKQGRTEITQAINSGAFYVLHRDHGEIQGWSKPEFNNKDVLALQNGNWTPVVFSINCLTGMYQYYPMPSYSKPSDLDGKGRSTCLAEAFIRHKDGGAVAVIAASQLSASKCNDAFAMEMFQLMYPKSNFRHQFPSYTPDNRSRISALDNDFLIISYLPIRKLGNLLNAAKLKVTQNFSGRSDRNNQIYHCFGDPSMEIKNVSPISPLVKITNSNSSLNPQLKVELSSSFKMVRVPRLEVGKVSWAQSSEYVFNSRDLVNYSYYIIGENIVPTPLSNITVRPMDYQIGGIDNVTREGGILNIRYSLPTGVQKADMQIRDIATGELVAVESVTDDNDTVIIETGSRGGIYVIELISGTEMIDSQKIICK